MRTSPASSLLALSLSAFACNPATSSEAEDDGIGEVTQEIYDPANPPTPIATDACDESTYSSASWTSATSAHFTAYYLPGTAAESDIAGILADRESAYTDIQTRLGLTVEPTITIYLSPNRLAAQAKGRGYGNAYPGSDRYEIVYTGAANSFEKTRVGHLLTRVLEYYIDPVNTKRIPLFSTGVAEVLDQSGRDLHDAYALQLHANTETRVRLVSFDSGDLNGKNAGRAGSLTRFLIDRYGMNTFLDIFRDTAVTSVSGCTMKSATYGCINSSAALTSMLDGILTARTGESWATVSAAWKAVVQAHLDSVKFGMPLADRNELKNLINTMDHAISTDDAAMYRSTMEGFYCEWGGEAMRSEIASRVVGSYGTTNSYIMRFIPIGTSNFTTARLLVRRVDESGMLSFHSLSVEKFPEGWRVTYGPDWW